MLQLFIALHNSEFEEADEYCPHCDNHFVIPAKTPELRIEVEGEEGYVFCNLKTSNNEKEGRKQRERESKAPFGIVCLWVGWMDE